MPRPSRPWFRFYVEAISDRKLKRLTPAQRWLWVALLAAARESPRPGFLLVAEGEPYTWPELADYAGVRAKEADGALVLMMRLGMLARETASDCWYLPHWDDRQFESDDVTARTQRSRERGRNVPTSPVGTPPETEAETDEIPPTPLAEECSPALLQQTENGNSADRERELEAVHAQRLAIVNTAKAAHFAQRRVGA